MSDVDEGTAVETTASGDGSDLTASDPGSPDDVARTPTPGDALRALPYEAAERGTRFISAQAMQARLFSVYDAAAAAEEALTLVQDQLTLTLNRSYYDAAEVEAMASQLDTLLALESLDAADLESPQTVDPRPEIRQPETPNPGPTPSGGPGGRPSLSSIRSRRSRSHPGPTALAPRGSTRCRKARSADTSTVS